MKEIELSSWAAFKAACITAKGLNCQYGELSDRYDLYGPDGSAILWHVSIMKDGGADVTDFETNYKATFNGKITQLDQDGAALSRIKVAPAGWNFNYRMIEVELSTNGSLTNNDTAGADVGDATIKLYDASGTLLSGAGVQATAVKTVIDLEPPYNICVVGGSIRMSTSPTQDVFLNVIAVPDLTVAQGGSKVFIQNVNLSYLNGTVGLVADGRAAKTLNYNATYHTNKFRFQFTHPAGYQFWCGILMEIYKQ